MVASIADLKHLIPALLVVLSLMSSALAQSVSPQIMDLAGTWSFRLDRQNEGVNQQWFLSPPSSPLPDRITLPGSLPAQGIGDDISVATHWTGQIINRAWFTAPEYEKYRQPGNIKVPFWLQPEKYYAGVAWYQREIDIPASWQGRRIVLSLERPHWQTRIWLDDRDLGANDSLSVPHEYDLGTPPPLPGKHRLTIRVDNSMVIDIGENSHSISDHTQGNWNGIVGRIALVASSPTYITDLQAYPHLATKSVTIKGRVVSSTPLAARSSITFSAELFNTVQTAILPPRSVELKPDGTFETEYPLGENAHTWDEFSPALYRLTATPTSPLIGDPTTITFGLREIATQGTQFTLNGRKTFFRGTLECCIFPLTGHPPTDADSWRRIIRIAKAHGLNLIRFHSWCPPEEAFTAADELGMYFQIEAASWANQSTTLGDGKPVDAWIYAESDRILKTYGNHPSFLLMPYGNEPGGQNFKTYLAQWVNHYKALDPRRLFTAGSGWPDLPESQFHILPNPRIQAWGQGLKSRINALPPETRTDYRAFIAAHSVPVISHEIGQWCAYPNFDEISKYTGYLKPRNFEIFRDSLAEHHMADQAHDFLIASGKLQALCYKEDIESALRTPGMGGFQLLDLHDFPGQGTALVGVLDPLWDSKGYITAAEYSRFCNSTVPLARLAKRVFTTDEKLAADIEVAHFGPAPLANMAAVWKLLADDGRAVATGTLPPRTIPIDNAIPLGNINLDLTQIPAPARYKLTVSLPTTPFENDWDIWVYPPTAAVSIATPPGVTIASTLDDATLSVLNAGGKVLLLIPPAQVTPDEHRPIALGFSSIFWNTAWTNHQAPHTLGILCDPKHPALAQFPTDPWNNWQWWYLLHNAAPMILDSLPPSVHPTIQVIDDWFTNRKLALLFECQVGPGKLMVSSLDLRAENPVARQLLHSLQTYMATDNLKPTMALTPTQIRSLQVPSK